MGEALYDVSMITPFQCRLGRTALNWTASDLARAAHIGIATVNRFEAGQPGNLSTQVLIRTALEQAGVVIIDEDGGGPGVRLKDPVSRTGGGDSDTDAAPLDRP